MQITEQIEQMLNPLLEGSDMFLVLIRIKPTNNIKVFIDADSGFSISKCSSINKKLYAAIEEAQLFPDGDFSLEVSSPGVDEPLKEIRQYIKNVGRQIEVTPLDGAVFTGTLKEVAEDKITVEVKIPKKKEVNTVVIPFSEIKQSVIQISF
jgi:ribosome maturation factor RimP